MIKNRKELLAKISPEIKRRREILLDIIESVFKDIAPEKLLRHAFPKKSLKKFDRIAVIAIGKAARGMARGILPLLDKKPFQILFADSGHPLPTAKGIQKTTKIIRTARELGERDLAIVLISGGGSAMLVAPIPEISLEDKIEMTRLLLKSGAAIDEMNVVRKHLSQVKGGNLAALLYPATVWGFVMSDVVGNDLSTIASGPLSPDKSTCSDAVRILKKYRIKAPRFVLETPKPGSKYFKKVEIKIVADHETILEKAVQKARKKGLRVISLGAEIKGEAQKMARKLVSSIKYQISGMRKKIFIGTGETTVTVRGKGFGGRNQEFALAGLEYLKPNQTLASLATDGVDGMCPEAISGAIADVEILKSAKQQRLGISKFLKRNDSYTFFKNTNGLIKTGPTGTNLGDLILLLSENP